MTELGKPASKPCWSPDSDKPFKAGTWLGFTALVWEMSEGNHGKLASAMSGSAVQALAASLSTTLGPKGPCIGTSFKVTVEGLACNFVLEVSSKGSYLVDPASSHMLVSKIKPCMSKYKQSIR